MKQEILKEMEAVSAQLKNACSRISEKSLSDRNYVLMAQMAGAMADTAEQESNAPLQKLFLTVQNVFLQKKDADIPRYVEELHVALDSEKRVAIDNEKRANALRGAFEKTSQIFDLNKSIREDLQTAAEIDLRYNNGKLSAETEAALQSFQYKLEGDTLVFRDEAESKAPKQVQSQEQGSVQIQNSKTETEVSKMESEPEAPASSTTSSKFKHISLTLPKGLTSEEKRALEQKLYADGARYDKWEIPAEKSRTGKPVSGKSWYVWADETTDLTPFRKYISPAKEKPAFSEGKDNKNIHDQDKADGPASLSSSPKHKTATAWKERTYLKLPSVNKSQFAEMIAYFKANGAAFDGEKKAWYITTDQDPAKFERFLPAEEVFKQQQEKGDGNSLREHLKENQKISMQERSSSAEEKRPELAERG